MSTYQAIQRLAIVAVVVLAIWHLFGLFAPILAPFVAAAVIAYMLDPAATRLTRLGLSRDVAAAIMIVAVVAGIFLFALLLYPLVGQQIDLLVRRIPRYALLNEAKLMEGAERAVASQARTYCIVASGRGPSNREVEHIANTVTKIKDKFGLHICCCLGLLQPEQAERLKAAGVDRINHNLNTSRAFYDTICSTQGSYGDYQGQVDCGQFRPDPTTPDRASWD